MMKARSDELVRKAMRRQPYVKSPAHLLFTPEEKAQSRQWHQDWLRAVHADRHITAVLRPKWEDLHAHDQAMARAGIRTAPRRHSQPPERVFNTPQPRLLGTKDPARLVSFTQDWRARHTYARSPSDPPLARLDRKTSSQELAALVEREHGHQRHLRKSWSSEQFETDSREHKRLHAGDDPLATKERALRSGKLYRGHSFSYPGEMTEDNELSKAMRKKEGLPPLGISEGPSTLRQHTPASSAFTARTGRGTGLTRMTPATL